MPRASNGATKPGTVPQFQHVKAGGRLYDWKQMQRVALQGHVGRPLSPGDAQQWAMVFPPQHEMITHSALTECEDQGRRDRDFRQYGQVAVRFYNALDQHVNATCPVLVSVDRALSCSRPRGGRRRVRCTRSARASGDSGSDDPHHPELSAASRPASERVFLCLEVVA